MAGPDHLRAHRYVAVLERGREREIVRRAAELASADPPWSLTQHEFDRVREQAADGPCPRARQLQRRAGVPWRALVAQAVGHRHPPSPAPEPAERQRRAPWTRAEALAAVGEFHAWATPGPYTVRRYRQWCALAPGRPWPRSLQRHGGLPALLAAPDHAPHPAVELLTSARTADAADLLYLIAQAPGLTARELAALTGIVERSVGRRLTALHRAGAVTRQRRAHARRPRGGARPYEYRLA